MTPTYPPARRLDLVETLHGRPIADPYRWLEDSATAETTAWLQAQDRLFAAAELPARGELRRRVADLLGAGTVGVPTWRGDRCFVQRRSAGQEHPVLYVADGDRPERPLLDPTTLDPAGTTTLDSYRPDPDGRLMAYQLSEGGDEESLLRVLDVATGEVVDGPIDRCRYSPIAWLPGGKAFYYVRRLPPEAVPDGEEQYHRRVYLHRVGTSPEQDVLIFGDGREKTEYFGVATSQDGRWLTVSAARGTAPRNDLWLADLSASAPEAPRLVPVQVGVDAETGVRVGRDGRLYVFTDRGAPRGRIAVGDPEDPAETGAAGWRDLVPEDPDAVLEDFALLDGPELDRPLLVASWTRHAIGEVSVHDLASGERVRDVALPGHGTVAGLTERPEGGHEAWIGYTDHTTPASVLRLDARGLAATGGEAAAGEVTTGGEVTTWAIAPAPASLPAIETRQVVYASKDGTPVRMLIVSPPGADGPRPTILYGYGGFSISLTPGYSAGILAWVEAGGSYAVAGLRGGLEEGEEWHRAGTFERKQNVFDDFHAAAEWLIAEGVTAPGMLGISGGSNGGLLVGAAITQRPDLYDAAVCSAPLLDMVRYEKFGLGATWNVEYGSADDPEQLGWLLGYSPYHHVRDGVRYPATLFTVFDGDTRVDPMHARKMCAALQHATAGDGPILLRREAEVGHGARAVSRTVELSADQLAFLAEHTGLSPL